MGIAEDLALLERKLAGLKVEYEHYFSGLAKLEPLPLRTEVQELIRRWNGQPINNTMHKFHYMSLVGRFNSLNGHWMRCVRELEEGTFKRDLFRVTLHEQERREREEKRRKLLDRMSAAAGGPVAGGGEGGAATDRGGDALYRELMAARAASGQRGGPTREAFAKLLREQGAEIRRRFGCSDVDFKVKVENGKVKLVARPVKHGAGR